ncbi:hypothetical protein MIR68_002648 [Amoeboaphelidium protococcarum]|nr:hypothetical protein MIR68_002648 [Amoeboaphelidium protococcarum]
MTVEQLDVLIVGAGLAGINMAISLHKERPNDQILVLEKTNDVGGVWSANAYPNLHCDVSWAVYAYQWDLEAAAKHFGRNQSPPGPLLKTYLQDVVRRHPFPLKCGVGVQKACWMPDDKLWHVHCDNGVLYVTKYLICSTGLLSTPKIPKDLIPQALSCKTRVVHTAQWNLSEADLDQVKRVAVIGNGSSATQTFTGLALRPSAPTVHWYWRSPKWIVPESDPPYSKLFFALAQRLPFLLTLERWRQMLRFDFLSNLVCTKPNLARWIMSQGVKSVYPQAEKINFIPDYPVGCSRLVISPSLFEAIDLPNVKLINDGIAKINEDATIETKDSTNCQPDEYDLIVLGTGFDVGRCLPHFDIRGENGLSLSEHWSECSRTLMGLTTDKFPNLFFLTGPNTNTTIGSVSVMVQYGVDYILKCLQMIDMECDGYPCILQTRSDAVDRHMDWLLKKLEQQPSASSQCSSWYRQNGRVSDTNWPAGMSKYGKLTKRPKKSNFEFV